MSRLLVALCVALVAAGLTGGAAGLGLLDRVEADSVDLRFHLRGERPAPEVAVIAIDAQTLGELPRWPFPRRYHARLLDELRRAGVRQVAYDVQFTEPTNERDDGALLDALDRARPVILATTEVDEDGATNVLGGEEMLREVGARAASALVPREAGGVVRRLPAEREGLVSLPLAAVEAATGRAPSREGFGDGGALIDYAGPAGTVDTISFSDVLARKVDPSRLRGKIVVVGATAPSLQDLHPAPTAAAMPGPELLANAIATVLRGAPLRAAPGWVAPVAVAGLAGLVAFAALALPVWALTLGALTLLGGLAAGAQAAFAAGLVLPLAAPVLAVVLAYLAALGERVASESRERGRTRALFGRYVPEAVVEELLAASGGRGRLPATRRDATVMFCDLRGFTSWAEGLEPERVLDMLNDYLGGMSEAILSHGGTVVSYMGDGIMAVFGSPLPREDHADAALAAAREMLGPRLAAFNASLAGEGAPAFRLGIGLNSGWVMSGTVGSERRLEYAAIGDTTNVAARLEALTKADGGGLLLSDATRRRLSAIPLELEDRGVVAVKGREEGVRLWALPAPRATRLAA